jgi:polysaccharide pyruvyl transferase WcaK-like protein
MKILLAGFYGEGNLGDETILQAICGSLPSGVRASVTSGSMAQGAAAPLRRRGLASWPAFLQAAAASGHAIFSGGILQDWSFEGITWFALRILAASTLGCRPSLWGAGIGPIRSRWGRKIAARALQRVSIAWLRDSESVQLFDELASVKGFSGADWSWAVPVEWQSEPRLNGPLGLNLRPWKSAPLNEMVAHQLRLNERQIVGLAARREDLRAIKNLAPAASVLQPSSFSEFAEACNNLSYGLAMRYHAGLAMLRAGLPLKLAAYDSKVISLAADAGVLTLQQNRVADFRTAREGFCRENEARLQNMRQSFVAILQHTA